MAAVVARERRVWFFRWPSLGAVALCAVTFVASSGLPHKTVSHSVNIALGVAMVLYALAPTLREISGSVQKWTMVAGSSALAVSVGFLLRLFTR
jgi:hypothetical protein